jgi:hypothetical protein
MMNNFVQESISIEVSNKISKALIIVLMMLIAFFLGYLQSISYDIQAALIVFTGLILISYSIFGKTSEAKLLFFAMLLKLLAAFAYIWVIVIFYKGGGDSIGYHRYGVQVAESLRHRQIPDIEFRLGTHSIYYATGILYTFIGPTMYGGFLVFSWLAFIGMYLFYKAFKTIFPDGNNKLFPFYCVLDESDR